jgi:transcriptional regulator with XRE-family HTH domain
MLRTLMPKPHPAFGIDDGWRARVRRALKARGWDQIELARRVKCSPSVISDLLNGKKHQSPYIAAIHLAFDWTPPRPLSQEEEELLKLYEQMGDIEKGRLLERARALAEGSKK